jgi:myo-inositol 2-dehydrogenase/D-chiro-inositol 1-dehydrogenase
MVRLGVVGAGWMAQLHISNFKRIDNCEVVAITDHRPNLMIAVADKFSIPRRYINPYELMDDNKVDAVAVVTYRSQTADYVLASLKAGKYVFSEKPIAPTTEIAKELMVYPEYFVAYNKRYDAGVILLQDIVQEIQETPLYIRSWNYGGKYDRSRYPSIRSGSRDTVEVIVPEWVPESLAHEYEKYLDLFCHDLNIFRIFAKPIHVLNVARDGQGIRVVTFTDGQRISTFETARKMQEEWNEGIELVYEKETIRLTFNSPLACVSALVARSKSFYPAKFCNTYYKEAEAFIEGINHGMAWKPSTGAHDAFKDIQLVEAIWKRLLFDS